MVFEVFRRRQKTMMVILAVLAMFAFVFAGAFDQFARHSQQTFGDRVVATAWDEPITAVQIAQMQAERRIANNFILKAASAVGQPLMQLPFSPEEPAVLEAIVLLGKAERMGMSVTDEDINEFIAGWTNNKLSRNDFYDILNGTGIASEGGPLGVNETELFRILGRELLIAQVTEILIPPVNRDTPLELWEELEPTLTNVQLEVVKVPVEDFRDKVAEPTEAELQEIYAKYKSVPGDLSEGIPGLLEPQKVNVEYLVASLDALSMNVTVTEEEAKKYYEENKEQYRLDKQAAPSLPGFDDVSIPAPPTPPASTKPEEKSEPKEEKPATKESPEAKEQPKAEEKAEPKPPEKKEQADSKETPAPAPANESKEAKPAESKDAKPANDGSAMIPGARAAMQVAALVTANLLQEAKPGEKDAKAEAEKAQPKAETPEPAKKDEPAPKAEAKTEAKTEPKAETKSEPKAESKPEPKAEAKTAAKPEPTAEADAKSQAAEKAETKSEEATGKAKAADAEVEYEPFEEVRDQIVEKLKTEKARQRAIELLESIRSKTMETYKDRYAVARSRYRQTAKRDEKGQVDMASFVPPTAPDLESIAKQYGFKYGKTGLVTYEEAGLKSGLQNAVEVLQEGTGSPFREVVFNQGLFRGRIFENDLEKEVILSWKIEDKPQYEPSFEEAKEKVLQLWKLEKARPLAEERAKELAEKVREAEGDLAKAVKDYKYSYVTTGLFPRRTQAPQMNPFAGPISIPTTIPEVPNAGSEFLDAVFKLKVGEVTVLPDETKQTYYVVKLKDRVEPDFSRFAQRYNLELLMNSSPMRSPQFLSQLPPEFQSSFIMELQMQRQEAIGRLMEEANVRQDVLPELEQQPESSELPEDAL